MSSVLLFLFVVSVGWTALATHEESLQDSPGRCEFNTSILDGVAQQSKQDGLIIVIARKGSTETRENLNRRRLHNVRAYLTEFLKPPVRRKSETILLAQGEPIEGLGQVDFYVEGKLFQSLKMRRNGDLSVAYCALEPPERPCPPAMKNLYPCKKS